MRQPSYRPGSPHQQSALKTSPRMESERQQEPGADTADQVGGRLPVKGKPGKCLDSQTSVLPSDRSSCSGRSTQRHMLANTKETAIYKGASCCHWGLVIVTPPRPFLAVNMTLFSQTKQGPFWGVARHSVWCAQTFWLLTEQPDLAVSSPDITALMRVYFYQPPWENCPALWQFVADKEFLIKIEISNHPQSSQPLCVPELWGEETCLCMGMQCFFLAMKNKSPHALTKRQPQKLGA